MKNKIKNILTNTTTWTVVYAGCAVFLSAAYFIDRSELLSLIWAVIAGLNVASLYINRRKK